MNYLRFISIFFSFTFLNFITQAQLGTGYQLPPQQIIDLVDAPATPTISIGAKVSKILLMELPALPALDDLAAEELRLAGLRINLTTNGPSRASYYTGLRLMDMDGKNETRIQGLPSKAQIRNIQWSPDEKYIAFTLTTGEGIRLWLIDLTTLSAKQLTDDKLNEVLWPAFKWMPDSKSLVYKGIDELRADIPARPRTATSPIIQESIGRKAALRTFQDLLQNEYDEQLFRFYASSQLKQVDLNGNIHTLIAEPCLIGQFDPSPDGKYLLLTQYTQPFSYEVPYSRFPQSYKIYDSSGKLVKTLADIPLSDDLPQGFDAVRKGIRSPQWRADQPSIVYWVEAIDQGDPATKASSREKVYFLKSPFEGNPIESVTLALRFGAISWGKDDFAIITERWYKDRISRTYAFDPNEENPELHLIFDRSTEDRYNDPGRFQLTTNDRGKRVLLFNDSKDQLFLFGQGASSEGNRPFIDSYDIPSGTTNRLWRSEAPYFEQPIQLIDSKKLYCITRRESVEEPPNYFMRRLMNKKPVQITSFPDPMPLLRTLQKEMIHYERADGVQLSGMLYLPAGFKVGIDEPLPGLLWAYPTEYKTSDAAGQLGSSPYTFTRVGASSPILLATLGYAVLNNASFPIVGEGIDEPNDYFIEQLIANAQAAIDKLVDMGVADPKKIAVSGHSYGAFMTANLLTHSNLFAAGIARSGAYNRSLTPFGFQSEERTYWQAPELYNRMSPFMHADKMKTPLLLIHGGEDNNSGTYTMQTERYYDALRGLGAAVRMVILPHESHGYNSRESVLHMHYEWIQWLERYVR